MIGDLKIQPGITAIIGSGGKTTLMTRLAQILPGRVIVSTSTRILPPVGLPLYTGDDLAEARRLLREHRCICAATPAEHGKLAAPAIDFAVLAGLCDYVLVEADGSKRLPLKAHLSHEPVIPPESRHRILLVGASGFYRPIRDVAHRYERFCELAGTDPDAPAHPEDVARVLRAEALCDSVIVNQAESVTALAAARELAKLLPELPVYAAALQKDWCQRL